MSVRPTLLVDLDGTITDSLPGIARSLRVALDEIGVRWPDDRDFRTAVGPPIPDTLAGLGVHGERAEAAITAYRRRYSSIGWSENSVYPGMAELLADLAADGYQMALATSKPEAQARKIVDHFELDHHFHFLGGADPTVGRYSKAEVIGHSLRALGLEPVEASAGGTGEVLMVGDRAHDVEGAAHFGIPCCIVKWGYGSPREWDTARWAAESTTELQSVIAGW